MNEFLTWGAVLGAGGSIVALIKFFMSLGALESEIKDTRSATTSAAAEAKFAAIQLADFKLTVTKEFASQTALSAAETRFLQAVEGMRSDFRNMSERLDRVLDNMGGRVKS